MNSLRQHLLLVNCKHIPFTKQINLNERNGGKNEISKLNKMYEVIQDQLLQKVNSQSNYIEHSQTI